MKSRSMRSGARWADGGAPAVASESAGMDVTAGVAWAGDELVGVPAGSDAPGGDAGRTGDGAVVRARGCGGALARSSFSGSTSSSLAPCSGGDVAGADAAPGRP